MKSDTAYIFFERTAHEANGIRECTVFIYLKWLLGQKLSLGLYNIKHMPFNSSIWKVTYAASKCIIRTECTAVREQNSISTDSMKLFPLTKNNAYNFLFSISTHQSNKYMTMLTERDPIFLLLKLWLCSTAKEDHSQITLNTMQPKKAQPYMMAFPFLSDSLLLPWILPWTEIISVQGLLVVVKRRIMELFAFLSNNPQALTQA